MSGVNKMQVLVRAMAALAVVLLAVTMMAVEVEARPPAKDSKLKACATSDKYVYPYWSSCDQPAELSVGYTYSVVSLAAILDLTELTPEYDESNDTFYMRLGKNGAIYVAVTESTESGPLPTSSPVYIYNIYSKRVLAWRQEGIDEYFLIEKETSSITDGAPFRFLLAEGVFLPCPLWWPIPECHAYSLVSDPSSDGTSSSSSYTGLQSYKEEGATYIKAASAGTPGDLPLFLSTTNSAMPFPTIRSVTAPEK